MKRSLLLAAALLAGCASTPDDADVTLVPPALSAGDRRIAELQTSLTELLERLDVLNDRIARLEGAVAQAQQAAAASTPPAPRSAEVATAVRPSPQRSVPLAIAGAQLAQSYRNALMLYGAGKAVEARKAFQAVFDTDPVGDLADNALFWIGETFFAAGDFANAMQYYQRIATEFGDQNKAPDAAYKLALVQGKTGDLALSRKTLQDVIEKYPYSSAAASAKQELQRIKY